MTLEPPQISEAELKTIEDTLGNAIDNSLIGRLILEIKRIKNELFHYKSEYQYYNFRSNTIDKQKEKLTCEVAEYFELFQKLKIFVENNKSSFNSEECNKILHAMSIIDVSHGNVAFTRLKNLNDINDFQSSNNASLIKENLYLRNELEKVEKELSLHSKLFLSLKSFMFAIQTEDLINIKNLIAEIICLKAEKKL